MINNVKVGDKVFVVHNRYTEDSRVSAVDTTTLIFEDTVFAIIDFGKCKKIALKSDVWMLSEYAEDDECYKLFKNYDDALECAKDYVYKHFIIDNTRIEK